MLLEDVAGEGGRRVEVACSVRASRQTSLVNADHILTHICSTYSLPYAYILLPNISFHLHTYN